MESLTSVLGWGSPIGLGLFIFLIAMTFYLISKTIRTLSKIDREINPKKKEV